MGKIKAALFDLDGTLFDTEGQYSVFWGRMARRYRPDIPHLEDIIKGTTLTSIYANYFPDEDIQKEITKGLNEWEAQMTYEFVPGALEFIEDLKAHGVKCAVVTSSNREKMLSVARQRPELDTLFDRILTSEDFTASKPAPDCYLQGAKVFDAQLDECVVFEDAFNGLQAGMSSGIFTVGVAISNPADTIRNYCHHVINDFTHFSYNQVDVLAWLKNHDIPFECYHHPEGKTIEDAKLWWKEDGSEHCKNLFFRNHKGNQHYLVSFQCDHDMDIHDMEQRLKARLMAKGLNSPGKLSFASAERMEKYLGLKPGSVSPFGLINDKEHHVIFFLDSKLQESETLSFHPNDCRGTVVIRRTDLEKIIDILGNTFEYTELY
ncbi:MAG: HAD-IA family hydrolase [Prevotella sp.]|nr:HAD-IA family hydrolase [Candidatus Prevotella equi]